MIGGGEWARAGMAAGAAVKVETAVARTLHRTLLAQLPASGARHTILSCNGAHQRCPPPGRLEEGMWGGGRKVCDNHCSRGNVLPLLVACCK